MRGAETCGREAGAAGFRGGSTASGAGWISARDIDLAARWFDRFGALAVLFGRLLPVIRTLISMPAGLAKMPVLLFTGASVLGILLYKFGAGRGGLPLMSSTTSSGASLSR